MLLISADLLLKNQGLQLRVWGKWWERIDFCVGPDRASRFLVPENCFAPSGALLPPSHGSLTFLIRAYVSTLFQTTLFSALLSSASGTHLPCTVTQ